MLSQPLKMPKSTPTLTQPVTASIFSCVANLGNTIMGSGMLGLPGAFKAGYLTGTFLLLFAAFFSSLGLHLLAVCAKKVQVSKPHMKPSFYSVASEAVPQLTLVIDAAVAFKCFGVACGYLITIADCMVSAMQFILGVSSDSDNLLVSRHFWVVLSVFCVAPMSFFRSLDALKFTSAMALVFIVFMCVTVVMYSADVDGLDPCEKFELPDFVPNVDDDGVCKGSIYATTDWGKTLSTLPIFIFSFTCHQNIFSVVSELNPNTILRVDKVIFISIYGAMALYMLVAYRGYFTYGDEVEGDIINNYPNNSLITVMRIAIAIMVGCSYPLQLDPSRKCILTLIDQVREKRMHNIIEEIENEEEEEEEEDEDEDEDEGDQVKLRTPKKIKSFVKAVDKPRYFYGVTLFFMFGTFVLAFVIKDLGTVLTVVGATGSTVVSYILPGTIFFFLHRGENDKLDEEGKGIKILRFLSVIQVCLGCVIMPVALYYVFGGSVSE